MSSDEQGLVVRGLSAGYGAAPVVAGIDLDVRPGEVVALLGLNGAGKSTTLRAIAGLLRHADGDVRVDGRPLAGAPYRRTRAQLGLMLEGRSVFPSLTAEENLAVGGVRFDEAVEMFPALEALRLRRGRLLSGGEQQMLALARAVLRRPRVLLIDELSLGLAPKICSELYANLDQLASRTGMAMLVVEQHIAFAAMVADRAYVLHQGAIALRFDGGLRGREPEVEELYLRAA